MRAPRATAIRRRTELLAVILHVQLYYIIYYLYIELRESQTAKITFYSMLQFTPDCTAISLTVERWLAVTLHMSLSGHAVERWLAWLSSREIRVKVEIFQLERICRATNPRERACLCTAKVWRDKSKKFARYASIRSLCKGSCRPLCLVWTHWRSFKTDSQNWHFYSENSRSFCFL